MSVKFDIVFIKISVMVKYILNKSHNIHKLSRLYAQKSICGLVVLDHAKRNKDLQYLRKYEF